MIPASLATERLVLDQPGAGDVDTIADYCTDPLFERYLTTPWPYRREHAVGFVVSHVPDGWASGSEFTWAIRVDGAFAGVIGVRAARSDVGFWLGAPFRGHGYMAEALSAVATAWFSAGHESLRWECLVGNVASAATARAAGFAYVGEAPADVPARDGSRPPAWHGILQPSSRTPQPGWPAPLG
jgi:RimJ/RimL family protein N-acetyltransferase